MARPPSNPQENPQGPDPRQRPQRPYKPISGGQSQPQGYPQPQQPPRSQPQQPSYQQPQQRPNPQSQPDFSRDGEPSIYPPEPVRPPQPVKSAYPVLPPRPTYPPQQRPSGNYRQPSGQPNYPPQQPPVHRQPSRPPNAAYQGIAKAARKGFPAWGWILIVVVTLGILAGGGFAAWTYLLKPNANPTSQASNPSGGQPSTSNPGVNTPSGGISSGGLGPKAAGPGQELIGQSGLDNNLKVTITAVDRYTQIVDPEDGTVIKANGAFLVVLYDLENVGSRERGAVILRLKDSTGKIYDITGNFVALATVKASDFYPDDILVQPGQKGKNYTIFEVPAEAKNFTAVFTG